MGTAAAIGGAALIGAYSSDRAAERSESATKHAADKASKTQLEMFNRMMELQAPWREVGMQALNEQALMMGLPGIPPEFTQDPTSEWQAWDEKRRKINDINKLKVFGMPIGGIAAKKLGPLGEEPEKYAPQEQGGQRNIGDIMQSLAESPMYQYEQQAMQKAAASRGLLNSGRSIRDEGRLAADHFQRRLAQLGALSGMGGGMAQGMGGMGMNAAGNVSNLQMIAGQAGANRAIQQGNNAANLLNQGAQAYAMYNFNNPPGQVPGDAYMPGAMYG